MNALVVTFDRWPLSRLGCYGHAQVATPHLDRFADGAVVFDSHFVENIDPHAANHAWWTGCFQFPLTCREQEHAFAWAPLLKAAGVNTHLFVTGDAQPHVRMARFEHVHTVGPETTARLDVEQSPFSILVEEASDFLKSVAARGHNRWLVWIHSPGIGPAGSSAPDEAHRGDARVPAAGDRETEHIAILDRSLGKLFDAAAENVGNADLLVIFTSAVGDSGTGTLQRTRPSGLEESVVHVPLIIRAPGAETGTRRRCLTQSVDLAPTLLEWFGINNTAGRLEGHSLLSIVRDQVASVRDHVCLGDDMRVRCVRTADFYLIEPAGAQGRNAEGVAATSGVTMTSPGETWGPLLFLKPEDFWDIHNVADQYPETVSRLQALADEKRTVVDRQA